MKQTKTPFTSKSSYETKQKKKRQKNKREKSSRCPDQWMPQHKKIQRCITFIPFEKKRKKEKSSFTLPVTIRWANLQLSQPFEYEVLWSPPSSKHTTLLHCTFNEGVTATDWFRCCFDLAIISITKKRQPIGFTSYILCEVFLPEINEKKRWRRRNKSISLHRSFAGGGESATRPIPHCIKMKEKKWNKIK